MYEKQFLNDAANQNYSKYYIDVDAKRKAYNWLEALNSSHEKGKLFVVI